MNLTLGGKPSTAPTKNTNMNYNSDTAPTSAMSATNSTSVNTLNNMDNVNVESLISSLYASTYSEVGDGFLDCLAKEIASITQVQTVMIQRLLTLKEYQDLRDNEGCPCIQLVGNESTRPMTKRNKSRETSPLVDSVEEEEEEIAAKNKIEYMLVKACYSSILDHNAFKKYAAIPISSLSLDSPQLKTLKYLNHHVSQDTSLSSTTPVYPEYNSFVGVRLDQVDLPIGLITVMHDKPLSEQQSWLIEKILAAVRPRTKNEIEKIRQRDNLIMMKNAALQDAESKIKFLADMSHEIRTPMNAVIALTDLLLQERYSLNDEQAEHLEVIQTSGNHLLTVINDILDISKINHDPKFKLENRRFSLRKCVKDALNMARHQASMTQYNKLVCVLECPADVNDNIPLNQLINQLEKIDPAGYNNIVLSQHHTEKTVLPLLWKIDADVPDHLMGDTMRLTQILLNLCSNAVKFTKSGGIRVKITRYVPPGKSTSSSEESNSTTKYQSFKQRYDAKIEGIYTRAMKRKNNNSGAGATSSSTTNKDEDMTTTEEEGGTTTEEEEDNEKVILEISVTDTGIGMPADRLPRLFKSFSQIDISTARRYGGTGLGLAISSMLVNRMGGGLWVESEEGLGSRFALTLPLTIAFGRPHSKIDGNGRGSESSSTFASSGMIASPPSPSSSVSDGGSSVDNNNESSSFLSAPFSPSNSTGYFPPQPLANNSNMASNINNTNNNSPSSSSTSGSNNNNSTNRSYKFPATPPINNNNSCKNNNNSLNISPNTNLPWEPLNIPSVPSTSNSNNTNNSNNNTTTNNSNKELHNIINKSSNRSSSPISVDTTSAEQRSPKSGSSSRVTLTKQYQPRKSNTNSGNHEENLALLYPIKIMLAEDNVLNQKIAISILKRLGYQDVIIASNGREALDLLRIHKFDVIFMDLYMPEMDGLEATRFIISERKHNIPPPPPTAAIERKTPPPLLNVNDVYIIALTASASKQDRQICIDAGMNDFISKPFTMMEMKSALKNCASKRKKRKKQQLRDEMAQKQALLQQQQQQQELISNALLVKYTSEDHPMTGTTEEDYEDAEEDAEVEEEEEEEEEENEERVSRKCQNISNASFGGGGTDGDNKRPTSTIIDDPMHTSFDDLPMITNTLPTPYDSSSN